MAVTSVIDKKMNVINIYLTVTLCIGALIGQFCKETIYSLHY